MLIKHSNTSNIIRFTLKNSSTGIGLTGLTNASAGLIIAIICNNEATTTVYTQAASNIETISALGTYAAPTANKCRFKEVDATNHKGLYEFQFANARFAIASARSLAISVTGAASLLDADYEIQLVSFDPHDSVRMGLTAMPNAAADGAGGLPISDAGGLDIDTLLGRITGNVALASGVDLTHIMGTILTEGVGGRLAAAFEKLFDVATPLLVASDVMRGTDSANTVVPDAAGVAPTVSEIQTEMEENGASLLDTIRDIVSHGTYGNSALQVLVAALQTDLDNGTDGLGALKTLIDAVPTVGEIQTEIEANGASVLDTIRDYIENVTYGLSALKTLIDANKTELDGFQGADGKCLISTDAQDLSGTLDVNIKTATATALDLILKNSIFALAIADAVADEEYTGETHNVVNSLARRVREIGAYAIHDGTAQAGANISITLAASASAIDGTYNRNLLVITDNTGVGQTRTIVDYDGATKIAIIDREWRTNPDATSTYQIVADDTPLVVDQGVAQAGTASTIRLREYASSTNDIYLCNIVIIIAGTGRGQARLIGSYNGSTKIITLCGDNWTITPDNTSVYVIIPYGAACISCVNDNALAQINAEVVDVLKTDTKGEPAQGAPGATLSIEDKIAYIYKFLRNNIWTTATAIKVYNDAGDAVDHKSTISDDGTTFKRGEFGSGP